ncbi:MBL fold metallo-hydrolase [Fictibacillus sp. 23RED33]|uniref:MBL fold metallo-hydrolase n=1 Tax=Fictibacillus sp. 23RED33 TaxID=2745879 RepID=UPI0018CCCFA9|nr:MBL fold metallo-hydrolase [Fictibacillus sp. 23RED33]MBH0175680.1 MBL fold metallo-hydrolase [Fictibacillus sp. 23RED33]
MVYDSDKQSEFNYFPMSSIADGIGEQITPDVYGLTTQIANVYFVRCQNKPDQYVLIDTGMPKSDKVILQFANKWFDGPPFAIILTHGHFDHVGAISTLLEKWHIPVYAHTLEMPYLNGSEDYDKPDPSVGGGLVSKLSPSFPNHGIDIKNSLHALPTDGTIPGLQGWRWIHTPGHTKGHISLFRDSDKTLLAGDAFVTVKQESLFDVLIQKQEISSPPKYFTTDWKVAKDSVIKLASLKPSVAATGHGNPMSGDNLEEGLMKLVKYFNEIALPKQGRYLQ